MNKMLMKEKNVGKEKRDWVISESYLSQIWLACRLVLFSLVQPYQSWYARNIISLFENSCLHECSFIRSLLLIVISIFNMICLNITYEIHSKLSLSHWIFLYWHSIIHCFYLDLFIWLCTVFNLNNIWSSIYHLSFNIHHFW